MKNLQSDPFSIDLAATVASCQGNGQQNPAPTLALATAPKAATAPHPESTARTHPARKAPPGVWGTEAMGSPVQPGGKSVPRPCSTAARLARRKELPVLFRWLLSAFQPEPLWACQWTNPNTSGVSGMRSRRGWSVYAVTTASTLGRLTAASRSRCRMSRLGLTGRMASREAL